MVSLDDLPQGVIRPDRTSDDGNSSIIVDEDKGQKKRKRQKQKEEEKGQEQEEDPNLPAYPRVLQQARRHMNKFENCVVLTRVGGFYELYFEHADECGPLLNLKVVQKKTVSGMVSMVIFAFPFALLI